MTISVNNKEHFIKEHTSLENFLVAMNISIKGIAIAINNVVITKQEWATTFLNNEDDITIIQATQGG